jgi:asparagine synthase (glutamine-hydrolysing)
VKTWFVVLPDADHDPAVLRSLRGWATSQIAHPSGRPWILGHWPAGQHEIVDTGATRTVLIGHYGGRLTDIDNLAGCFHRITSDNGIVRAQGTVSGVRRLFVGRINGMPVAADRADLFGDTPTKNIAARLLYPSIPTGLLDRQDLWPGVEAVPPDSYLRMDADRTYRCVRRWVPPDPVLSLAEGAEALRVELEAAVEARSAGATVAADLSGGLDSTPLCFLAAKSADRLVAVTMGAESPDHDDRRWAADAAAALSIADHVVLDTDSLPDMFAGVDRHVGQLDEPMLWTRTRERNLAIARLCAERGATVRITGHGGDEVLHAPLSHLHGLRARREMRRRLRLCTARFRWDSGAVARAIKDSRPYGQWLADAAHELTAPPDLGGPEAMFGWSTQMRMPPWATAAAVDAARATLLELSRNTEALAAQRGGHMALHQVRQLGSSIRLVNQLGVLPVEAPFLDDRVLDICLAVAPEERSRPDAYKPLMVEAMRDVMPPESLRRTTKGEFSADVHGGRRRQRAALAAVFDKPRLADEGLVDADALRRAATGLFPPQIPLFALDATLAVETWLGGDRRCGWLTG